MSFNVWGEGEDRDVRWPLIAESVAGLELDFVGIQEVFRSADLEDVRKAGAFESSFVPSDKTGLGLLTRGKIVKAESIVLPPSALEDYRRYLLWASVELDGWAINFYNMHLSWKPEDAEVRELQTDSILRFVEKKPAADLDILTGDLNAACEAISVQKLALRFKDVFTVFNRYNPGFTWSHRNKYTLRAPELPERRLDYVMVGHTPRHKMRVMDASVVFDQTINNVWISDHFGMCAEVEVTRDG